MGTLILAGQTLTAGEGQGQLSQYYGLADTTPTTVTAAALANLSTAYVIPAGEAYANAAYELRCGGYGVWGSTQQQLNLKAYLNGALSNGATGAIAATAFSASLGFVYRATIDLVCVDGASQWMWTMDAIVTQTAAAALPGTAADNTVPVSSGPHAGPATASVSSAITVALQADWASTTGAPTITNTWTKFRKVA